MEADTSTETQTPAKADSRKVFFYGEPQRLQCVNFLLHLAPFSNDTLLIVGAVGSGKTVILKQFLNKGGEAWRYCFLQGEGLATVGDLLQALQARFSIRSLEDAPRTEQIEVLVEEFQAVQKRNQRVMLVIDDADKAGEEVVAFLDQLQDGFRRANDGISLILTAGEAFANHPEVENLRNHGMHVFELTPLTLDETQNYLRNFLRKNGMPNDALSNGEMKRIHREANGNFAVTYSLARAAIGKSRHRLLGHADEEDEAELSSAAPQQNVEVPKSRYFIPLSLLLVFALVIGFRYGNIPVPDFIGGLDREKGAPEPTAAQPLPPTVSDEAGEEAIDGEDAATLHALEGEPAPITQPSPPEALTDAFDQLARGGALGEGDQAASSGEEQSLPPVTEDGSALPEKTVPQLLAEAAQVPVEPVSATEPEKAAEPPAPSVATDASKLASTGPADSTEPTAAPPAEQVKALPAKVEPPTEAPVKPAAEKAQAEPASVLAPVAAADQDPKLETPTPVSAPEPKPAPAEVRGEAWLLEQPEASYTLQIMALNSDAAFHKMLSKVDDPSQFAIYRLMRSDKTLYALVYGVYDSRAAADAAKAELPKSLGKVSPLPKRLRDVQKDIRAMPQ